MLGDWDLRDFEWSLAIDELRSRRNFEGFLSIDIDRSQWNFEGSLAIVKLNFQRDFDSWSLSIDESRQRWEFEWSLAIDERKLHREFGFSLNVGKRGEMTILCLTHTLDDSFSNILADIQTPIEIQFLVGCGRLSIFSSNIFCSNLDSVFDCLIYGIALCQQLVTFLAPATACCMKFPQKS